MEVGDVRARLSAVVDKTGFEQYERYLDQVRREVAQKEKFKARFGADFDERAFARYRKAVSDADDAQGRMVRGSGRLRTSMGALFIGGGAVAAGVMAFQALTRAAIGAYNAFEESQKVARRQALVIKTMGQDAGATAGHVNSLAAALGRKAAIDDDLIISGANVIRTFRNIQNEAGEGNAVFDRTLKATLDLSSAFGLDLQSAAIQLGKALNEPAKGAAALSRTGAIARSDVEKLKQMAEAGVPILQQQKFVLKAVEDQVKGTAAQNATATGKMAQSWGELQELIGEALAPAFRDVAKWLRGFIDEMRAGEGAGGTFVDALKLIWNSLKFGVEMIGLAVDMIRVFGDKFLGVITTVLRGAQAMVEGLSKVPLIGGKFKGLAQDIDSVADSIDGFREQLRPLSEEEKRANKQVEEHADRVLELQGRLDGLKRGTREYREVARALRREQSDLNSAFRRAEDAGRAAGRGISTVGDGAVAASSAVAAAASTIAENVNRLAKGLQARGISFTPASTPRGRQTQDRVFGGLPGFGGLAGGGWVGAPGERGRDTVPALLGRGEAVLNRHQQGVIEGLLGDGFLDRLFARVQTPHYLAAGGRVPDVTIMGPPGGYRRVAQGASDLMDRRAESFIARLAPNVAGGDGLVAQVLRAIAWARSQGWAGTFSGLRSYAEQVRLYNELGPKYAAVPGTSNHGKGTAIDVSDPEGFAQAMASAPPGSRLVRGMSWEPWHFSITGFAKGGWAEKARNLAGLARNAVRGNRVGQAFERQISALERQYGQKDRKFGQSDETFVIETDTGAVIDQAAVAKRTGELGDLVARRTAIRDLAQQYREAVTSALGAYRAARDRVQRALSVVGARKGKKAQRMRDGYRSQLAGYRGRIDELGELRARLGGDVVDYQLDLGDLRNEIRALKPSALLGGSAAMAAIGGADGELVDRAAGQDGGGGDVGLPGGPVAPDADQQARFSQLEQINMVLQRTVAIQSGALSAFRSPGDIGAGYASAIVAARQQPGTEAPWMTRGGELVTAPGGDGGVTINVNQNNLHPGDPGVLLAVGQAAAAGFGYQGFRDAPRASVGY